ncbi:RNase HII [Hathewaya proteolytica DSM 3090]|uniref:Ribonuclease HII n=1 Tax=Hathewaya proteolytica DSM 3090 TaxID=1121331 RepID=A0A1M6J7F9_9CLOT|nr:ribonuclease HII [Hathewaya proteolytica]SHJ42653.1 RNase HII [Hathewaya proteolytica DSM 3090]
MYKNLSEIHSASILDIKKAMEPYMNCMDKYYHTDELRCTLEALSQDKRTGVIKIHSMILKRKLDFENEILRVNGLYNFDKKYNVRYLAGVDEVGRGPLAGPIVAAAVLLDLEKVICYINDSKKIVESKRRQLSNLIKDSAISYNIVEISNEGIDAKGIGYCNNEVFIKAVEGLSISPDLILTDGYSIKNYDKIKNEFVIKGDTKSASIACASIIAKVYRDDLMKKYHEKYPQYGFDKNVGYGTSEHINAIKKYGSTDIHRKSFLTRIDV